MTDEKQVHQGFTFTLTLLAALLLTTLGSQLLEGVAPQWLRVANDTSHAVWPQGWFFFAHAPEDNVRVFYSIGANDKFGHSLTRPQTAPDRLWGIRRSGSSQLTETVVIFDRIPQSMWTTCVGLSVDECWALVRGRPPYRGVNDAMTPQFCGRLMAAIEGPASWNEQGNNAIPQRPLVQAVMVELVCPR